MGRMTETVLEMPRRDCYGVSEDPAGVDISQMTNDMLRNKRFKAQIDSRQPKPRGLPNTNIKDSRNARKDLSKEVGDLKMEKQKKYSVHKDIDNANRVDTIVYENARQTSLEALKREMDQRRRDRDYRRKN